MLVTILQKHQFIFSNVVPFNAQTDKLLLLDFTAANIDITDEIISDTVTFSTYIYNKLQIHNCKYGIGGYNEHRTVYSRSKVFDDGSEPRRLHLGVDIWGEAVTPVFAALDGVVHSFAFNNTYGDYGTTIILQHQLEGFVFHTLYGHLALQDLDGLYEGKSIAKGDIVAHFGMPHENGEWPPHLHFQLIIDMQHKKGDYPGVCKFNERDQYLANCPDADLILQMLQFAK
ncbi:MAG: peptidoglycan DD-metalloendopeptidase family protein [Deinococcales bacterium]|nr:peptidoglycan DD-metalloendopeptidase family protein [Chitinophagaceae bacterium]